MVLLISEHLADITDMLCIFHEVIDGINHSVLFLIMVGLVLV